MPRPKKSDTNGAAAIKIENAFWDLLKTERYADITVLRVSQEAGVNRNSFYYHYRDIDNLAYLAVKHNAEHEVSRAWIAGLLAAFQGNGAWPAVTADAAILPHAERIILCARSDSSYLKQLITDFLQEVWFDFFSIDKERLSTVEKLQADFVFAGLIATLGSREIQESPASMSLLVRTELGKAILSTIEKIASAQNDSRET